MVAGTMISDAGWLMESISFSVGLMIGTEDNARTSTF